MFESLRDGRVFAVATYRNPEHYVPDYSGAEQEAQQCGDDSDVPGAKPEVRGDSRADTTQHGVSDVTTERSLWNLESGELQLRSGGHRAVLVDRDYGLTPRHRVRATGESGDNAPLSGFSLMTFELGTTYREFMTEAPDLAPNHESSATTAAGDPPRQLRRSLNGKVIAGVARGLGNRFDIDANIFRVIFVILALFWGLGVAIYLAMWVFVPQVEGEVVNERSRRPVSNSHRLTAAVLAGVLAFAVLLVLLARGGAIRIGAPSLALLWLVFLISLAGVAIRTPARRLTVRRFFAGIFFVASSGLILLVGALIGFLDSTGVSLLDGNGAHTWQPTALRDVQHRYTTELGSATVEVAAVAFPSSGFTVDASTAVGILRIDVPANAVVSITTHVGIGPVDFFSGCEPGGELRVEPVVRLRRRTSIAGASPLDRRACRYQANHYRALEVIDDVCLVTRQQWGCAMTTGSRSLSSMEDLAGSIADLRASGSGLTRVSR